MYETICNFSYLLVGLAVVALATYRLFKGSREFFADSHSDGKPAAYMARFVVIGFCLTMTGYLAVTGSFGPSGVDPSQLVRIETTRAGFLMLVLGIDLLITLFVLATLHGRARTEAAPPQPTAA
jgi:hypothetical protein